MRGLRPLTRSPIYRVSHCFTHPLAPSHLAGFLRGGKV